MYGYELDEDGDPRLLVVAMLVAVALWAGVVIGILYATGVLGSSSRPACTSGASSITLGAPARATWYPTGCRHP